MAVAISVEGRSSFINYGVASRERNVPLSEQPGARAGGVAATGTADRCRAMSHALVIGGTGMLADVSLHLAKTGRLVTVVARSPVRLERLAASAADLPGEVRPLAIDYRKTSELREALDRARLEAGPFGLVVCWMHSSAPEGPAAVAASAGRGSQRCRFVHVLGSVLTDPTELATRWTDRMRERSEITYQQVLLGYRPAVGRVRWLTNAEISAEVIRAIDAEVPVHVAGQIRPWSARP